jgi:hypothetical protein
MKFFKQCFLNLLPAFHAEHLVFSPLSDSRQGWFQWILTLYDKTYPLWFIFVNLPHHTQFGRTPECVLFSRAINTSVSTNLGFNENSLGFTRIEFDMERTFQPKEGEAQLFIYEEKSVCFDHFLNQPIPPYNLTDNYTSEKDGDGLPVRSH